MKSNVPQIDFSKFDITLVRHGEGLHNVKGSDRIYDYGRDDLLTLTPLGFSQAESVGAKMARRLKDNFVTILVAPSLRTRQTAFIMERFIRNNMVRPGSGGTVQIETDFGATEFHHITNGVPIEGWDFDAFMDNPWETRELTSKREFQQTPELMNPYQQFIYASSMLRHRLLTKRLDDEEALRNSRFGKQHFVYVGNHFTLNMINVFIRSAFLKSVGVLEEDALEMLTMDGGLVFCEPDDYITLSEKSVQRSIDLSDAFQNGGPSSECVAEFVAAGRRLLAGALHIPMENCAMVDPTLGGVLGGKIVRFPRYGSSKGICKRPPFYDMDQALSGLQQAYLKLNAEFRSKTPAEQE